MHLSTSIVSPFCKDSILKSVWMMSCWSSGLKVWCSIKFQMHSVAERIASTHSALVSIRMRRRSIWSRSILCICVIAISENRWVAVLRIASSWFRKSENVMSISCDIISGGNLLSSCLCSFEIGITDMLKQCEIRTSAKKRTL